MSDQVQAAHGTQSEGHALVTDWSYGFYSTQYTSLKHHKNEALSMCENVILGQGWKPWWDNQESWGRKSWNVN